MCAERAASTQAATTNRRKNIVKTARAHHLAEAEATYTHVPQMEAFIRFQLMTAARRSETMSLTWRDIDFDQQTAFIPESKNGRPRNLVLRMDVIALLRQLPRDGEKVFPMSVEALRRHGYASAPLPAWSAMTNCMSTTCSMRPFLASPMREASSPAAFRLLTFRLSAGTAIHACCCAIPSFACPALPSDWTKVSLTRTKL